MPNRLNGLDSLQPRAGASWTAPHQNRKKHFFPAQPKFDPIYHFLDQYATLDWKWAARKCSTGWTACSPVQGPLEPHLIKIEKKNCIASKSTRTRDPLNNRLICYGWAIKQLPEKWGNYFTYTLYLWLNNFPNLDRSSAAVLTSHCFEERRGPCSASCHAAVDSH